MRLLDERGRLFGAINVIDLGVLVFVVLLVPLSYGAYALFRTLPPRLTDAVPRAVPFAPGVEQRVQLKGEHLRPFLRAKLSSIDARSYAVQSPETADISFADVPPGTYDIVLFDEAQEVTRLANGLDVLPPPLQLVGSFTGAAATESRLVQGLKLETADRSTAEVLRLDSSAAGAKRGATLRLTCHLSAARDCLVANAPVRAGTVLPLVSSGTTMTFVVSELRADAAWLQVKVRFMGLPESLQHVRPGDVDIHVDSPSAASPIAGVTSGAIVMSLGELLKGQGSYTITAARPQSAGSDLSGYGVLSAAVPVDAQTADLLIPVDSRSLYRGVAIHPGSILAFDTPKYRVEALILSVTSA